MKFTTDPSQLEIDHDNDSEVLAMMRNMYPMFQDAQLIEAKENLERYLKLAWRIADRITSESGSAFDSSPNNSYDTGAKVEIDS
jgi:hypothetical protein